MGTLIFLIEASSEVEGGFGFKFDLLESNIINLLILLGVLFYYGSKVVGNILAERKAKIAEKIQEAEEKQKKAAATLAEEQQKLAQAKETAEKIRSEAEVNAQKAKEAILAQGEKEIERIKATAQADLNSEQERAIAELKRRVATLALERVESQLGNILNEEAQQKLIDRSIAQLGGN
ncbi:MAG: F0F1 ATP synthase subunit B [Xenococcaceae cyanobacterium]